MNEGYLFGGWSLTQEGLITSPGGWVPSSCLLSWAVCTRSREHVSARTNMTKASPTRLAPTFFIACTPGSTSMTVSLIVTWSVFCTTGVLNHSWTIDARRHISASLNLINVPFQSICDLCLMLMRRHIGWRRGCHSMTRLPALSSIIIPSVTTWSIRISMIISRRV
jgi:hypothetical protein